MITLPLGCVPFILPGGNNKDDKYGHCDLISGDTWNADGYK